MDKNKRATTSRNCNGSNISSNSKQKYKDLFVYYKNNFVNVSQLMQKSFTLIYVIHEGKPTLQRVSATRRFTTLYRGELATIIWEVIQSAKDGINE